MTDTQQADPRHEVEALGREIYGDSFAAFLATPRTSLGGETPAALIERGDVEGVREVLVRALHGDFG